MMQKLDLSSPWNIYRSKLAALFELDDAVTVGSVVNGENGPSVTVEVSDHAKAAALKKLLASPEFGNVKLSVEVEDTAAEESEADILKAAFAYNRLVRTVEVDVDFTGTKHTFLVMEPSVLQFFADNLADYRGNITTLAADTARDVLNLTETQICTADLMEN